MEEPFHALTMAEMLQLNREALERFGGLYAEENGNFHNRASLEYILEAVLFPVFGVARYPEPLDKIAALVQQILVKHLFHDGNKRTGLAVCTALLRMNHFAFTPCKEDEDFMVRIAEKRLPVESVAAWLRTRVQ